MALSASDIQTVYSLLSNALSPDHSLRNPAESALAQCESRPGFCSCLLEIVAAKDLVSQVDVRLLATVYFKNSVARYWRQRRDFPGINTEEKMHLQNKLMLHIREENLKIALQVAVLISKIARIDYPKEWYLERYFELEDISSLQDNGMPELFSTLSQQLQSADIIASHRIFLVLFRTLKELSTKRLISDQKKFAEVAAQLFDYCWKLWQSDVQSILQNFAALSQCFSANSLPGQLDDFFLICERWFLCSKIIRQLVVCGHQSDITSAEQVQSVKIVCPVILDAVQSFLPYYSCFPKQQIRLLEFVKKSCIKSMKILIAIQARHPYSFGDRCILIPAMEFCFNKIANPDPAILSFEPFLIQCMVMVKSVLECKEYQRSPIGQVISDNRVTLEQRKKNISSAAADVLHNIFSSERVVLLCNILIRRYFIFSTDDLDEWSENPESFHHEQDMMQWTEKMRPCAEALYIVLFENYKHILGPVVVSILRDAMSNCPAAESEITPGMLLKDAAYTAAGHVYYELSSFVNFDEWFNGTLVLELSNHHPNMRIIHRKIAIVLGQWASEVKVDTRKVVYSALVSLLQHNDVAVRLASCRSLCYLTQDCNFSGDDFREYLPMCCTSCFKLVEDVQEFDSKVQVLNLISVMIEHAGEKIIPFGNQLMIFFQKIWEESGGQSLFQIQLLTALQNFVSSLGYQSPICYNMLLPILRRGIDINNPDELNLLEDSVLLWEATVSHAPSMVTDLLDLFPYLVPIMERSFDHLQAAVSIVEDYILSGGSEFLNRHASDLVKVLEIIVENANDKGMLSTLPIIDTLIQLYPAEVPPLIGSILQKLLIVCMSRDNNNPSRATLQATSGAILARLLVLNTNYLATLASGSSLVLALQKEGLSTNQNILLCLVDIWLDKIDIVTTLQRKTYALALSIILTLRLPEVMDKLDEILSVCTSVLLGGAEDSSEESSDDVVNSLGGNSEGYGYAAVPSKELRKRQIRASDPIKHISLEKLLRENLQACAALHGDASFNVAINSIHPNALAQLKQALKMTYRT